MIDPVTGYEWDEDKDAIDAVVQELIDERGYYQEYHRGLACPSATKLRAEARDILKAREASIAPGM